MTENKKIDRLWDALRLAADWHPDPEMFEEALEGVLEPTEQDLFDGHLAVCEECRLAGRMFEEAFSGAPGSREDPDESIADDEHCAVLYRPVLLRAADAGASPPPPAELPGIFPDPDRVLAEDQGLRIAWGDDRRYPRVLVVETAPDAAPILEVIGRAVDHARFAPGGAWLAPIGIRWVWPLGEDHDDGPLALEFSRATGAITFILDLGEGTDSEPPR
ncbi:MAG: zf-HC2 domain-containing protein [Pseudomonadota bacterium]